MKEKNRAICAIMPSVAALVLAGCASPRPSRVAMNQGESWELVLPTQLVADIRAGRPLEDLPEYSRRDLELGVHTPRVPTALDRWPDTRPDQHLPRYIYLPRTENRFIFFSSPGTRTIFPGY